MRNITGTRNIRDRRRAHTTVGFVARHLMVTQARGRFEQVEGTIQVAEDALESTAIAMISTDSITTSAVQRDSHLRSADFLDAEAFSSIRYVSRQIVGGDSGPKWPSWTTP